MLLSLKYFRNFMLRFANNTRNSRLVILSTLSICICKKFQNFQNGLCISGYLCLAIRNNIIKDSKVFINKNQDEN